MAKRRTGRQRAASRRNIKKAQIVSARKRRRLSKTGVLKAGVAVGTVIGGSVIARKVYNNQFETFHHGTTHHSARKIVKEGYKGGNGIGISNYVDKNIHSGQMFLTKGESGYGYSQVKVRIKKKYVKNLITADYNDWPEVQYSISARTMEKAKKHGIVKVSYKPPFARSRKYLRNKEKYGYRYG